VAWDRGPVRLGVKQRDDGASIPMWHDSEVAAIAYAIQHILEHRASRTSATADAATSTMETPPSSTPGMPVMAGKKCPECGARAMIRKDACEYCTQCGHVGACG